MAAPANPHRRTDIENALKRAKPSDMLTLQAVATIYGVSKSRFVTVRETMVDFPAGIEQGTALIYPAREALKAMLKHETRHDAAAKARVERTKAILGDLRKERDKTATDHGIPARELQILNRLATEIEERERVQREYIPAAEVSRIAGDVFSAISEFMAGLSNKVDPNGLLDPNLRALIDTNSGQALLGLHRTLKVLLDADVVAGSPGGAPSSARKPRTRRKRT